MNIPAIATVFAKINKDTFSTFAKLYVLSDIFWGGWMNGVMAYGMLVSFVLGMGMVVFGLFAIWKERRDNARQRA